MNSNPKNHLIGKVKQKDDLQSLASNQMDMDPPSLAGTSSSSISTVHPDIIETHVLTRLDPTALASASCASSRLYSLTSNETLWTNICNSTWPSTNHPRLRHVISSFPKGPRSFFSHAFTNPDMATSSSSMNLDCPPGLISAVDIHFQERHIFSKVVETETTDSSPFRVDLLETKDPVPTGIPHPVNEEMYREILEGLKLSWILIDPIGRRAMNVSSYKPVTAAERRWLSTGEVHLRYAWVFSAGQEGSSLEYVKCGVTATFSASHTGEMHVSKVSLHLEDMFGKHLNGKDSLAILHKGMMGKRGVVKGREEEGRRRYDAYKKMRRIKIILGEPGFLPRSKIEPGGKWSWLRGDESYFPSYKAGEADEYVTTYVNRGGQVMVTCKGSLCGEVCTGRW
ncbi:hypothetical protein WN944_004889 [Citrus x changshan-huyou]|uniref:F-box domain-containing protein n=1 Tax=Citrus x changshan-huyou TaxID=2935761 RepID=A0AAP0M2A2_9ROSI